MKKEDIITVAAIVVLAPIVIGGIVTLIKVGTSAASTIAYKIKIQKGLKKGSIVKVDDRYYKVEINNIVEEEA